ncbi:unnamed protein product, partial [Rotaria sp. Silwood1]
MFSKVDQEKAV